MFSLLLLINIFFVYSIHLNVAYWDQDTLPIPNKEQGYKKCGMLKKSFICDPDYILTSNERIYLNQQLEAFQNATSVVSFKLNLKLKKYNKI